MTHYIVRMVDGKRVITQKDESNSTSASDRYSVTKELDTKKQPISNNDDLLRELSDTLKQISSGRSSYREVNPQSYMRDIISYEEAMSQSRDALTPQYQNLYEQTAVDMAQNLDRAGLYNSLYGQALAMDAQQAVDRDLLTAVSDLALKMQNESREQAQMLLDSAIQENQFAAKQDQSQRDEAWQYLLDIYQLMQKQATTTSSNSKAANSSLQLGSSNSDALAAFLEMLRG